MDERTKEALRRWDLYFWQLGDKSIDVTRLQDNSGDWAVQVGTVRLPRPIRTVGDLARLLECLGWESGQEGGDG